MDEKALRGLITEVKDGKLSRRSFVQRMVALGLTAPMATQMLTFSGLPASAATEEKFKYKPTKRGGGGPLKVLWWQGATLLNPHFAIGTKDQDATRIFYEPLAGWDPDGDLFPVLAAEIPSRENGGLAADGKSVAHTHLRYMNPFPRNLGAILKSFEKVLVPELNCGQLSLLLRNQFLVDAKGYNKVEGKPFLVNELVAVINEFHG